MVKKKPRKVELFDELGNSRGYFDLRNQLNFLTGKEWLFSTKSVLPKSFPPSFQHKLRNEHGGQKPPELCQEIIETFTKGGDIVLDPFCGVGGTMIACTLAGREGIGIEINQSWIEVYKKVCNREGITSQKVIHGDSRMILSNFSDKGDVSKNDKGKSNKENLAQKFDQMVDFILTDIPYWNMDSVEKSKGTYKKVGEEAKGVFSDKSKLSRFNEGENEHYQTKEEWKELLREVFLGCYTHLKNRGYCAIFIGNMYNNNRYHFLTHDVVQIMDEIGYIPKGEIIWYDVAKKLHLYGINYSWIPSQVHQSILVFRKETGEEISEEKKAKIHRKNKNYVKKNKKASQKFTLEKYF